VRLVWFKPVPNAGGYPPLKSYVIAPLEPRAGRLSGLLLLLYAFYSVFGRFIGVIRWALDRIA
jgi:hypothetical protein